MTLSADLDKLVTKAASLQKERGFGARIAIDGPSGSGKTTLAFKLVEMFDLAFVVQTDTFHIPLEAARRLLPEKGRPGAMIDWQRFRETVLHRQSRGEEIRIDWIHPLTGELAAAHVVDPRTILICDGTFSTRSELQSLYDFRLFVDAPAEIRRERITLRDATMGADWTDYIQNVWIPEENRYLEWAREQAYDLAIEGR